MSGKDFDRSSQGSRCGTPEVRLGRQRSHVERQKDSELWDLPKVRHGALIELSYSEFGRDVRAGVQIAPQKGLIGNRTTFQGTSC